MKGIFWKNLWQTAAAISFLLAAWLLAYFAVGNELLLPSPLSSLAEGWRLCKEAAFWKGFSLTLLRAVLAFVLSFIFAVVFAVSSYLVPTFEKLFAPVVSALRSLPVLAVLLILLVLLGGDKAPVAVAFLSLFPMLYAGILAAISGIDEKLIDTAQVLGTSWQRKVFHIYLPLSAPYILRESGAALSFSVKLVVSAEVLARTAFSLGGMMQEAQAYAEVARLFALVSASFLAGLLMELAFAALTALAERKIR